jgi:hypothetical protein
MPAATYQVGQGRYDRLTGDTEPAAEIVPERHTELGAGFVKDQQDFASVAAKVAACSGADRGLHYAPTASAIRLPWLRRIGLW